MFLSRKNQKNRQIVWGFRVIGSGQYEIPGSMTLLKVACLICKYCIVIWKIKSKRSNYFVLGKSRSVQICSSKVSTLESGIDVGGAINVAPRKFGKKISIAA